MEPESDGCVPGDIIITSVESRFAVGRVLGPPGAGKWWESLTVVCGLREAIVRARQHASVNPGVRIWLHEGGATFLPVTPELGHASD